MRDKKNFTYEEAVEYVLQIPKFTKKNTPEDTRRFMNIWEDPEKAPGLFMWREPMGRVPSAPISTLYWKRPVISRAFFVSPHLVDVRERFRLKGQMIPKKISRKFL